MLKIAKCYFESDEEKLRKLAKNKYRTIWRKKNSKKKYGRNRHVEMSEEKI